MGYIRKVTKQAIRGKVGFSVPAAVYNANFARLGRKFRAASRRCQEPGWGQVEQVERPGPPRSASQARTQPGRSTAEIPRLEPPRRRGMGARPAARGTQQAGRG